MIYLPVRRARRCAHAHFTMIELLIVVVIILILAAFLLGSVIKSQQRARYGRWQGFIRDLRQDPDVLACYGFDDNEDAAIVPNLALGNVGDVDYRPKDYDGRVNGAEWHRNEGRWLGKAGMSFDGVDDYLALGIDGRKGSYEGVTVIAWVRPLAATDQAIVSLDGNELWEVGAQAGPANSIGYTWTTTDRTGATTRHATPNRYRVGDWRMVVGWYNPKGTLADKMIYVDDQLDNQDKVHGGEPLGAGTRPVTYGFIGVDSAAGTLGGAHGSRFFRGYIDEVVIYKRALTSQEIVDHWRMGTP